MLNTQVLPLIIILLGVAGTTCAESPDERIAVARNMSSAGDLDGALERLEPLLQANDLDQLSKQRAEELATEVLHLRGEAHFRQGNIPKALDDFDRQIRLRPDQAAEHWQRGIAYYYAGEFEKGIRQFESHRSVNPEDVENAVWHFLCVVAAPEGSVKKARQRLIPVTRDPRVPMHQIHRLFAGSAMPEEVLQAGEKAGGAAKFYADLYVGLFYEALDRKDESLRLVARAAADPAAKNNYMGDVARVHVTLRKKIAAAARDPG